MIKHICVGAAFKIIRNVCVRKIFRCGAVYEKSCIASGGFDFPVSDIKFGNITAPLILFVFYKNKIIFFY
jgi:hypothetical protein